MPDHAQTMAERYRAGRPASWESAAAMLRFIRDLDDHANVMRTDLGPVILFSDGSRHRMGGAAEDSSVKPLVRLTSVDAPLDAAQERVERHMHHLARLYLQSQITSDAYRAAAADLRGMAAEPSRN